MKGFIELCRNDSEPSFLKEVLIIMLGSGQQCPIVKSFIKGDLLSCDGSSAKNLQFSPRQSLSVFTEFLAGANH